MQKVDGVQSAQVSLKEGLTILELRSGNKVTLAQLRTVIKNNGFVSKDAVVVAAGTASKNGASGAFEVTGTGERLSPVSALVAAEGGRWRFTVPAPR